jgi:hypothetical protein
MTIALLNDVDRFDTVQFRVTFRDAAGDVADPDTVTFYVENPLGVQDSYVYDSDAEATRISEGIFNLEWQVDVSGTWDILCVGEGTVDQSSRGRVHVRRDPFTIS